jgi:hypothetical protein
VVTLSSSDTEENLEQLFPSLPRDSVSHALEPFSYCYSDQFKDWLEANDMAVSVYVALTIDASSSRTSTVNVPHDDRTSFTDGSSTRQLHSWSASTREPNRQKCAAVGAPWGKSKKTKIDAGRALAVRSPHGG